MLSIDLSETNISFCVFPVL